jgi:hypothetical protein
MKLNQATADFTLSVKIFDPVILKTDKRKVIFNFIISWEPIAIFFYMKIIIIKPFYLEQL